MIYSDVQAKKILKFIVEEDNSGNGLEREKILSYLKVSYSDNRYWKEEYCDYHLLMLESGGFVTLSKDNGDRNKDNFKITWAGHQLD